VRASPGAAAFDQHGAVGSPDTPPPADLAVPNGGQTYCNFLGSGTSSQPCAPDAMSRSTNSHTTKRLPSRISGSVLSLRRTSVAAPPSLTIASTGDFKAKARCEMKPAEPGSRRLEPDSSGRAVRAAAGISPNDCGSGY